MSAPPTFDAFRLARTGETLQGEATLADLPRLALSVLDRDARVRYAIEGRIDDEGHPGAVMRLQSRLPLRCERCNEPLQFVLEREVPFRFVRDERELDALPIEDDELEIVVGSPAMALWPWIEDEAILSLPLVSRHADCALPLAEGPAAPGAGHTGPFAALAELKRRDGGGETAG